MNKSESKYFNTAKKIDEAFISLLEYKSLKYITVKEICEKAGVNRSTFYLHYETIDDLLNESVDFVNNKFFEHFNVDSDEFIKSIEKRSAKELIFITPEYLVPYLTFIKDNKQIFKSVVNQSKHLGYNQTFKKMFNHIFNPILAKFNFPEDERKYILIFYIKGIMAVIMEWIKNGCDAPIDKICNIIIKCIISDDNAEY